MSPAVQQFVDALAKLGINFLPYVKYIAFAYVAWFVFVGVVAVALFGFIFYQFARNWNNFNG